MRNLKRALSLALASVMLLGMMVVGTSAAFADADEIVNTEAVEITAGLGLFAGSDGKFNPKGNVTRAQMATVIVKMLYGSEINADQYKGVDKFNDVAAFEGGWAEGYINLCANLGVVGGYGDGTFKPGNSVTTAEAVTMIINALGVDAGKGTWPLTVMAKAEEMKLFEELAVKPGTNVALTRDQLASIVLEGVKYSPADATGYQVEGIPNIVFDEMSDALTAAMAKYPGDPNAANKISEVVGEDTLWKTVFEVKEVYGWVTENQATNPDAKWTKVGSLQLDLETGLDMIGHKVVAYYAEDWSSEAEPGKAYCIVEDAKYITVDEDIAADRKEFKAAFGSKALTIGTGVYTDGNYVATSAYDIATETGYDDQAWNANAGTYVIDENNAIIGFIAPADVKVAKVGTIVTTAGLEAISLAGRKWENNADSDVIDEYEGIAKNDIVTYVLVGNSNAAQANKIMVTKTTAVEGKITKTFTKDNEAYITVNGTDYVQTGAGSIQGLLTSVSDFDATYTVYLTSAGEWIGFESADAAANLSNIYYVKAVYTITTENAYAQTVDTTYAQVVDMEGKEAQIVLGVDYQSGNTDDVAVTGDLANWQDSNRGFYTFKAVSGTAAAKINAMKGTAVTNTYDPDKKNLYVDELASSTAISSKDNVYTTVGNADAFVTANTKFIIIDGAAQTQLSTAVVTGTIKKTLAENADVILSVDAKDNVIIEAVVIDNSNLSVSADNGVYISAVQIAGEAGVGSNEYQYNVYFLKDGTVKPITMAGQWTSGAGFYEFTYDASTELYTLDPASSSNFDAYDTTFSSIYGESILRTPAFTKGVEAGKAFIFDVRGEKAIEKHQTCNYAISSLADLEMAAEEHTISISVLLDDTAADAENVLAIFVTGVTYVPQV